ncbi:MAG: hypothetical protein IPK64_13665 [bacterium]|nr:hypothetical protein [bacterium]
MRILKSLLTLTLVLSLAGAAFAADLHDTSKIPVSKAPAIGVTSAQALDCSGAIELSLSLGDNVYTGTTVGAPNNVTTYSCSGWNESGGEVVYHVTMPADAIWEVGLTDMTADLDLAVLDACDENLGCLIVVDSGVYVSEPLPGEYYFVVDGYGGATGPFTITFTLTDFVPPPSMCDLIQDVTGTYFTGDTCDGFNNVSVEDCGAYTENGLEHYYEIQVPAGCYFTANVTYDTADGALWVLDSCAPGYACVGYADDTLDGDLETVTYTNATGAMQTVILVLDSWGTAACGTYTFDFVTDCAVATEVESFGGVKALFR